MRIVEQMSLAVVGVRVVICRDDASVRCVKCVVCIGVWRMREIGCSFGELEFRSAQMCCYYDSAAIS